MCGGPTRCELPLGARMLECEPGRTPGGAGPSPLNMPWPPASPPTSLSGSSPRPSSPGSLSAPSVTTTDRSISSSSTAKSIRLTHPARLRGGRGSGEPDPARRQQPGNQPAAPPPDGRRGRARRGGASRLQRRQRPVHRCCARARRSELLGAGRIEETQARIRDWAEAPPVRDGSSAVAGPPAAKVDCRPGSCWTRRCRIDRPTWCPRMAVPGG